MNKPVSASSKLSADLVKSARMGGISYERYVASIDLHHREMAGNHEAVYFEDAELAFLQGLSEPVTILAIVEDWCPDVIATLPILARIVDAAPALTLHVLPRPAFRSLADLYPGPDGHSHVPTYVAIDASSQLLGIFVERAESINEIVLNSGQSKQAEIRQRYGGLSRDIVPPEVLSELVAESLIERRALRAIERQELLNWLKQAVELLQVARPTSGSDPRAGDGA